MLPSSNALLADLPKQEYTQLTTHMKLVSLHKGQTLFEADEVPEFVYYPVGAIVSMLRDLDGGQVVESHIMGATCMVGIGTLGQPSFYRATVRTAGLAYKLRASDLVRAREHCPVYVKRSLQSMNGVMGQMSAGLGCSIRHPVSKQLIRWLLRTYDRLLEPSIPMTHQEIAELLGFQRVTITKTLSGLSECGAIATRRGEIVLLDRQKLEEQVCECYQVDIRHRQIFRWYGDGRQSA